MTASRLVLGMLAAALAGAQVYGADESGNATERKINQLERRIARLTADYSLAREDAEEAKRQLKEIRSRLNALGGAALGGTEERLIETASQLEAARAELDAVKQSALRLNSAIAAYTRSALVEEPEAKQELETALQDMEVALGLRMTQQDELDGTMDEARVLSIDPESGLIVINAGSKAKVEVGMPMEITRGDQLIALAVVTDVRKSVAGLLVQKHLNQNLSVSVGDRVSVTSND